MLSDVPFVMCWCLVFDPAEPTLLGWCRISKIELDARSDKSRFITVVAGFGYTTVKSTAKFAAIKQADDWVAKNAPYLFRLIEVQPAYPPEK